MNREILFRGHTIPFQEEDYNYDGEWKYGFLHVDTHGNHFIIENSKTGRMYPGYEVIPESCGQYTGLKDKKNGTRIFEGDICMHGQSVRIVEYRWSNFSLIRPSKTETILLSFSPDAYVIGNIHEHPELLNG